MSLSFPSFPLPTLYPNPYYANSLRTHIINMLETMSPLAYRDFLWPLQNFQYFVIIDFEATCDKKTIPHPQEIIEFPSVIVNGATGQINACFQTYVRPVCNPVLTDFCKELTGIQQFQVDKAITLSEALVLHDKWLEHVGIKSTNFVVVTWSNWDCQVMLESECRFKNIQKPDYFNQWINLRIPFSEIFGNVRCNLKQAVEIAGLVWQGRVHCGLDDAINISRLFSVIMSRGYKFSVTKSLLQNLKQTSSTQFLPPQILQRPQLGRTPFQHFPDNAEDYRHCFCGAKSFKKMIKKLGPKYGHFFYGCGNWTVRRGACCNYFEWVTP